MKITSINRHRINIDGEGITTLVGMAGCNMNCVYCINYNELHDKEAREVDAKTLASELMQDYCYFVATGGGVTLGGGEPLLQYEDILELRKELPSSVALNIETSLNVEVNNILRFVESVDMLYIDIKSMNPLIYRSYTGQSNKALMKNLRKIAETDLMLKCTIRIPNISNYTKESDIRKTVEQMYKMGFYNTNVFTYRVKQGGN